MPPCSCVLWKPVNTQLRSLHTCRLGNPLGHDRCEGKQTEFCFCSELLIELPYPGKLRRMKILAIDLQKILLCVYTCHLFTGYDLLNHEVLKRVKRLDINICRTFNTALKGMTQERILLGIK